MRLLEYAQSKERAGEIIGRLRDRGIPTYSKVGGSPWISPYQLAIFVCIDEQFDDAVAVLANREHVVSNPVDVAEFERQSRTTGLSFLAKWSTITLLLVLAIFAIFVFLSGVPWVGA